MNQQALVVSSALYSENNSLAEAIYFSDWNSDQNSDRKGNSSATVSEKRFVLRQIWKKNILNC